MTIIRFIIDNRNFIIEIKRFIFKNPGSFIETVKPYIENQSSLAKPI